MIMKLFENIAEYQAFKRKYEMMGQLEEERLLEASKDPNSIGDFLQFMDDLKAFPEDERLAQLVNEEELQADIERQRLLLKLDTRK